MAGVLARKAAAVQCNAPAHQGMVYMYNDSNIGSCSTKSLRSLWTQNSTICTRFLSSGNVGFVVWCARLSHSIFLLKEKPRLLKQSPKTVSLSLNDAFFVDCLSSGQPTPTYWWFRNGHILPGHTTANLTVTILGASDGGLYSCTAHNSLGNASMEVEITG